VKDPIDEIILIGTKEVETKEEKVETSVPFKTLKEDDPTLLKGETKVKREGVAGKKIVTYTVYYENGKEVTREIQSEEIVSQPVDEIILVGTKVVETKIESVEEEIPYKTVKENDPTLPVGRTKVK